MVPFDGPPGTSAPAGMAPQYTVVNREIKGGIINSNLRLFQHSKLYGSFGAMKENCIEYLNMFWLVTTPSHDKSLHDYCKVTSRSTSQLVLPHVTKMWIS